MFLSGALDNLVKIFCLSDAHEENVKNKVYYLYNNLG
jgi:hypothetical protein